MEGNKESLILEKQKRVNNIRKELTRVAGLITEEDDWFYGSELRLQGIALKQEGAELDETRRQLQADSNSKSREIRDELKDFEDEKNRQMEEEINQREAPQINGRGIINSNLLGEDDDMGELDGDEMFL